MTGEDKRRSVGLEVLQFYEQLPFNYSSSVDREAERVTERNALPYLGVPESVFRDCHALLDVGCGSGWLCNSAAHYYKTPEVVGIDFNPVAVTRASAVSQKLGLNSRFVVADLFEYTPPHAAYDLVSSIGVLHHTSDCLYAIETVMRTMVADGGTFICGLYHRYGRKPFLEHFRRLLANKAGKEDLLREFSLLHPAITDKTLLESWFRDQVLHPQESQHTLEEIHHLTRKNNWSLAGTSINQFGKIGNIEDLFVSERELERVAEGKLKERRYYPGFFITILKKPGTNASSGNPSPDNGPGSGPR